MVWGIKLLSLDDVVNKQNKWSYCSWVCGLRSEWSVFSVSQSADVVSLGQRGHWFDAKPLMCFHQQKYPWLTLPVIGRNLQSTWICFSFLLSDAQYWKITYCCCFFPPLSVIYLNNYVIIWFVKAQINILWALVTTKTHYVFVTISTVNRIRKAKV